MSDKPITDIEKAEISKILADINKGVTRINEIIGGNGAQNTAHTYWPCIEEEPLDKKSIKRVLGDFYKHVAMYNYMTDALHVPKSYRENLRWDEYCKNDAKLTQEFFTKNFTDIYLVALLAMPVRREDYPAFARWTYPGKKLHPTTVSIQQLQPTTADKGYVPVLCNFLVRKNSSGLLRLFNPYSWLGAGHPLGHGSAYARVKTCLSAVAANVAGNPQFQESIRLGYQR